MGASGLLSSLIMPAKTDGAQISFLDAPSYLTFGRTKSDLKMSQQRTQLWAAEADIDEDIDLNLAIGSYGQNDQYEEGESLQDLRETCR